MARGRRKGNPDSKRAKEAEILGPEVASAIDQGDESTLRKMLTEVGADVTVLENAMEADTDLKIKKEQVKEASEVYREGFKRLKIKRRWISQRLVDIGKDASSGEVDGPRELDEDAKLAGAVADVVGRGDVPGVEVFEEDPRSPFSKKRTPAN